MKIAFVSGLGRVWGSYSPECLDRDTGTTVGGGEAALLNLAFGLAENHGHAVTVFYPGEATRYRGVDFQPLPLSTVAVATGDWDCVVSWSDHKLLGYARPGVLRVFSQQLNDVPSDPYFWRDMDGFISPAQTHMDFLFAPIPPEWRAHVKTAVIPNGVNLDLFKDPVSFNLRKRMVGYWSSPDRGLHHLLRIWPKVRRHVPDAELHIFYHLQRYIDSIAGMEKYPEFYWRARSVKGAFGRLKPSDGVVVHGPVNRWQLAKWQKRTKVMAYPLDTLQFTEGFSIACLEAYAAGCRVIAHPADAVEEVHGEAVEWVRGNIYASEYLPRFTEAVVRALLSNENPLAVAGHAKSKAFQWSHAATKLNTFLEGLRA
jgi:glycosyltransferase involved in cell wall biosynthesis